MSAKFCTNCGTALAPEAKFCGECGSPVTAAPAAPEKDRAAGERRQVTVLFADLTGFTKLSQELGAEETHTLLNQYFETVDAVVEDYGGTIDKHLGDAVMAVFGAPTAHDDDPLRAVRAALDIQQSMAGLSQAVGREMQTHISIASGVVVASGTGSGSHTEYTVTGDSVNLASRLDDLARPGEILISSEVRRTVESQVDCDPVGELEVRGLDRPVKVSRVRALTDDQHRASNRVFVGRDAELRQFEALVDSCASTGHGQAVLLRGEAGIGKSRLVEQFTEIALAKGFARHKGLVLDFGAGKGRDAVGAMLRSMLRVPQSGDKDTRRVAVEAAITDGLANADQRVFLNDLLDLPQSAEDRVMFDAMDNLTRTERTHAVVAHLIKTLSARHPLLITIEDVHCADSISLGYLASMAAVVGDCPTVLVMTSRIEGDPLDQSWRTAAGGASLTTIDLGPLRAAEANSMASGFVDTTSRFVRHCIERADGNPLFLEQLLQGAEDADEDSVPGTIQSLILARMDRTDAADREALQAASAMGQRFSLDALRHLISDPRYDCSGLIERQLVRREGQDYLFAHAIVREGVYSSLLEVKKREIHQRVAEWFENVDYVLRAEHLDRAENPDAVDAYRHAAEIESKQFRFERALQLIGRGREIATDDGDAFRLLMLEGTCQSDIGNPAEAVEIYRQAQDVATNDVGQCHAWIGLASGMRLVDDYDQALATLDRAEPIVRDNDMHRELSQVHY